MAQPEASDATKRTMATARYVNTIESRFLKIRQSVTLCEREAAGARISRMSQADLFAGSPAR
jgi:hypothetical protein